MSTAYGIADGDFVWMRRDAPPRYSQIDEATPLVASRKAVDGNVKQVLGIRRSTLLLSLYVIFYVVYLVTGGLVFTVLEAPVEEELRTSVMKTKMDFLAANPSVKESDLEDLIGKIVGASSKGIDASNNVTGDTNWNFGQALFFSSTVVTTIGYGHVTPLSRAGKSFCILYAVVGIPLTLMLLTAVVERFMVVSTNFLDFLNYRLGKSWRPFAIKVFHLSIIVAILLVFFLFIPAAIFAHLEPKWNYMDSLYYCFVSLTTIGLGDYVPGDSPNQLFRQVYKVLTTGYLLSGLTFLLFTLTVFHDIPQLNVGNYFLLQSDEEEDAGAAASPTKMPGRSPEMSDSNRSNRTGSDVDGGDDFVGMVASGDGHRGKIIDRALP